MKSAENLLRVSKDSVIILTMAGTGTSTHTPTGGNDTIAWSKWLVENNVPKKQADAHAQLISKAVGQSAASKEDLKITKTELSNDIQLVKADLMSEIQKSKTELLFWMLGMFLGLAGLMVALIKFL
jgi:hypothetical protein